MSADQIWLDALWPLLESHLPGPGSRVLDLGCGPLGGFVPALRRHGHTAIGVDPHAPEGSDFVQASFEDYLPPKRFDAAIACTSLHHVADLDVLVERLVAALAPRGQLIMVEWAWERLDEATVSWCFDRVDDTAGPSWLSARRDEWKASGLSWEHYLTSWAGHHHLHRSAAVLRHLEDDFEGGLVADVPYFFPDLTGTSFEDEKAAIDTGIIRPTALIYVGRLRHGRGTAAGFPRATRCE